MATAFVGFAISTFYTACIHTASRLLPRRMHTTAMVMISSIGQSGSAIFPFVIGTSVCSSHACAMLRPIFRRYQQQEGHMDCAASHRRSSGSSVHLLAAGPKDPKARALKYVYANFGKSLSCFRFPCSSFWGTVHQIDIDG